MVKYFEILPKKLRKCSSIIHQELSITSKIWMFNEMLFSALVDMIMSGLPQTSGY